MWLTQTVVCVYVLFCHFVKYCDCRFRKGFRIDSAKQVLYLCSFWWKLISSWGSNTFRKQKNWNRTSLIECVHVKKFMVQSIKCGFVLRWCVERRTTNWTIISNHRPTKTKKEDKHQKRIYFSTPFQLGIWYQWAKLNRTLICPRYWIDLFGFNHTDHSN